MGGISRRKCPSIFRVGVVGIIIFIFFIDVFFFFFGGGGCLVWVLLCNICDTNITTIKLNCLFIVIETHSVNQNTSMTSIKLVNDIGKLFVIISF